MIKRLRFTSESAARAYLQALEYERLDGSFDATTITIVHIGPIRPDGCAGCLNIPSQDAPSNCPVLTGAGPCPAACWHVDITGELPEGTLPGEIFVSNPKHTFL